MTTLIIWLGSIAAYLSAWLMNARWWYQRVRPWNEPVACMYPQTCQHTGSCRRRWGMVDTENEAIRTALGAGFFWWVYPAFFAVCRLMMSASRPLPEEVAVRIELLEDESGRLRRGQDRS